MKQCYIEFLNYVYSGRDILIVINPIEQIKSNYLTYI